MQIKKDNKKISHVIPFKLFSENRKTKTINIVYLIIYSIDLIARNI